MLTSRHSQDKDADCLLYGWITPVGHVWYKRRLEVISLSRTSGMISPTACSAVWCSLAGHVLTLSVLPYNAHPLQELFVRHVMRNFLNHISKPG